MAAAAATHGMYSRANVKKDSTEAVEENSDLNASSKGSDEESRILSELITASFAVKPVIKAVTVFQFAKPSGAKIGASVRPTAARMLSELSETRVSEKPKFCKNHKITVERKMTVKAFTKKSLAFCAMSVKVLRAVGRR